MGICTVKDNPRKPNPDAEAEWPVSASKGSYDIQHSIHDCDWSRRVTHASRMRCEAWKSLSNIVAYARGSYIYLDQYPTCDHSPLARL